MEFSQEFIIDIMINAGGYLAAGLIGVIFYSLFSKRTAKKENPRIVSKSIDTVEIDTESNVIIKSEPQKRVEFIKLGTQKEPQVLESRVKSESLKPDVKLSGRLDRKEVISLARKMLDAGAANEKIKKILPVSDSELALLSLNNK